MRELLGEIAEFARARRRPSPLVRVTLAGGEQFFLASLEARPGDGFVTLQVWLDFKGQCPIVAGSSSFHEFDVRPVVDYKTVNIPFEEMLDVVVTPAITSNGRLPCS